MDEITLFEIFGCIDVLPDGNGYRVLKSRLVRERELID